MQRATRHLFVPLALLAAIAFAPSRASADRARPLYAGFGGGPYVLFDCCGVQGRLSGAFGWHFGGTDLGFVMAVEAATTVGPDYLMFMGGLRVGGDIEVTGDLDFGVILRPSALFAAGVLDGNGGGFVGHGYFLTQLGFDIRFAFADRAVVFWIRPAAFDLMIFWDRPTRGDWYLTGAYQAMAGFDFQF
jgi:hypothetical protein